MNNNIDYKYFDREISWLEFNYRVLQEAVDKTNPLLERIKFLGIFSNNQDEFFRVRIATIRRLIELKYKSKSGENTYLQSNLDDILLKIKQQQAEFENIYIDIIKELNEHNIYKLNEKILTSEQGRFVQKYFTEQVQSHLFPIMLKSLKSNSILNEKSIYFAIELLRNDKPEKNTYAIMEIPTNQVSRFLFLPEKNGKKYFILLDDIIRYCLNEVFSRFKFQEYNAYTFKFTRDSELDIDSDVSKSFLEILSSSVERRKKATTLRLVYDKDMPQDLLEAVSSKLKIKSEEQLIKGERYHNFKDYMDFPAIQGLPNLPKQAPIAHKHIPENGSIIKAIRERDIMLHYPYQSFQYIVDLLREASIDSKVQSIKITLYRLAKPSNVVNALINAARNGKRVTAFLELKARFDEEANIYWTEELQKNGVQVLSSIPEIKVHCKLILIDRKEKDIIRQYANVSTGNFNEKTSTVYSDTSVLTCNPKITSEINEVFNLFKFSFRTNNFKQLIVSPFSTRSTFIKLINQEIRNAQQGKEAWCYIKLNNLSDIKLIKKLYQASNAGVKIYCIVRGICKLIPGVKNLSENIRIISIVDSYLEHSRIMIFCNNNDEKYYISSADWMVRNLDNRIEVTVPILDKEIQKEIKEIILLQLKDNTKARLIDSKMKNKYVETKGKQYRSQKEIHDFIKQVHSK
ncbi:MAG: polyphosphate kinase 1 [Bacteroidales bacterium]|nr:polyphosphate kinase 1 [Bacteroidales bacterium]